MFAEATMLGGAVVLFFILLCVAAAVGLTVFWIWMLVSAVKNKGLSDGEKVGWVLAIVFFHFIGSLLYLFIGHPKRRMVAVATLKEQMTQIIIKPPRTLAEKG